MECVGGAVRRGGGRIEVERVSEIRLTLVLGNFVCLHMIV